MTGYHYGPRPLIIKVKADIAELCSGMEPNQTKLTHSRESSKPSIPGRRLLPQGDWLVREPRWLQKTAGKLQSLLSAEACYSKTMSSSFWRTKYSLFLAYETEVFNAGSKRRPIYFSSALFIITNF